MTSFNAQQRYGPCFVSAFGSSVIRGASRWLDAPPCTAASIPDSPSVSAVAAAIAAAERQRFLNEANGTSSYRSSRSIAVASRRDPPFARLSPSGDGHARIRGPARDG